MDRPLTDSEICKLLYMLSEMPDIIDDTIYNVMHDSEEDRHYSAVAATNYLKCYVEIMGILGQPLPFSDMKSYFANSGWPEYYEQFEKIRKEEAAHYIGVQF